MVELEETDERGVLLQALKGYLEELRDSGVDELSFAELPACDDDCRAIGNPRARLLLVMTGAGFAGEAGELLEKIVKAMGFAATEVCLLSFSAHPLGAADAAGARREALLSRIAVVAPEVVVALGEPAAQLLLDSCEPIDTLRGNFYDLAGIPLMPTLHPEALLENLALKREVWSDMRQVMKRLAPESR